ncbi:MAG: hypothetical protein Q8P67_26965 [archaeon]|nr:hypothetical protein [archaeon]
MHRVSDVAALGRLSPSTRGVSVPRRWLYDPHLDDPMKSAKERFIHAEGLPRTAAQKLADEAATIQQELEENEHTGNDLFSLIEALSNKSQIEVISADDMEHVPSLLEDDDDIDVILEGLPRLDTRSKISEGRDRIETSRITALSFAVGFVGQWQDRLTGLLLTLDEWVSDDRWLPPFYRTVIKDAFFLDLDKSLLGKHNPEGWKFHHIDAWLGEKLGWQRVVDPKAAGSSFGYLYLPFSVFESLSGEEIGNLEPSAASGPSQPPPRFVARRLAHQYLSAERVHRTVIYSPKPEAESPNAPATVWIREPKWQRAVVKNFFGEPWLGYELAFDANSEEVAIRACPKKMTAAANRVLDSMQAAASSSLDMLQSLAQLPMHAPFGVPLTKEAIVSGDLAKSRDLTKTCHIDLWILSRIFHWMNHVRGYTRGLRGAAPVRLADNASVFAIDIGLVEEPWQRTLADRWLHQMLGWSLQINPAPEPSFAYFSHELLTSNSEYFVSSPPDLVSYSQVTPAHLAWITIQRELNSEVRGLAHFIDSKTFLRAADTQYNFREPISRWMRPVVSSFFERFLGYNIIWKSSRRISLIPSPLAMQEAVEVLIGRKDLQSAVETMVIHAKTDPHVDDLSEGEEELPNV